MKFSCELSKNSIFSKIKILTFIRLNCWNFDVNYFKRFMLVHEEFFSGIQRLKLSAVYD